MFSAQDPPISSDDSDETVSDPPRPDRSRPGAAPKASTAAKARGKVRVPAKKSSIAEGAVIVIEDSPPNTQQPATLAQEAGQPATVASVAINFAEPVQPAASRGSPVSQQPSSRRMHQTQGATPALQKDDGFRPQHQYASSGGPVGAAPQRGISAWSTPGLVARADPLEASQRNQLCTGAAAVNTDPSRRSVDRRATPLSGAAMESPGSVYASPSSSLSEGGGAAAAHPGQGCDESTGGKHGSYMTAGPAEEVTREDSALWRDTEKQKDASPPGVGNRAVGDSTGGAAPMKGDRLSADPEGADVLNGWDEQGFGVEMDGPGLSDSWGYGGNDTSGCYRPCRLQCLPSQLICM